MGGQGVVRLELFSLALLTEAPADPSPDAVMASSDQHSTVLDTNGLRVVRMTLEPGEQDTWHSHSDEMVHFLVAASGRIHMSDESTMDVEVP